MKEDNLINRYISLPEPYIHPLGKDMILQITVKYDDNIYICIPLNDVDRKIVKTTFNQEHIYFLTSDIVKVLLPENINIDIADILTI